MITEIKITSETRVYRAKGNYTNLDNVVESKKTFVSKGWSMTKRVINTNVWKNVEYIETTVGELLKKNPKFDVNNISIK